MRTNEELLYEIKALRQQIESKTIRVKSIIYFLIGAVGMEILMKIF